MNNDTLLECLAPYLPYGLKVQYFDDERGIKRTCTIEQVHIPDELTIVDPYHQFDVEIADIKPLLIPLDALTGELAEWLVRTKDKDNYASKSDFKKDIKRYFEEPLSVPYFFAQQIFKLHGDLFGLIPEGKAIDKRTLK